MKRRAFLLGLIAAPAAPLAAKWTQPQPAGWFIKDEPLNLQRYHRCVGMPPVFAIGFTGTLRENMVQAASRDVYRKFVEHWRAKGWVLE